MIQTVEIDGFSVEIEVLPVERVNIRICRSENKFKIATPVKLPLDYIRKCVAPYIARIEYEKEIARQKREQDRQRIEKKPWPAIVYVLGKPYKPEFVEFNGKQKIEIEDECFKIYVRPILQRKVSGNK